MFSKALEIVEKYTLPVIYSQRLFSGEVRSGCGSFIVVNDQGWILTAAHIVTEIMAAVQHQKEIANYQNAVAKIEADPNLTAKAKRKQVRHLSSNSKWVTHQAVIWGMAQSAIPTFHYNAFADIAVGKLEPFKPEWIKGYPVFKDPKEPMPSGTSLCRLGFPFHQIKATFDPASGFQLAPETFPVPKFPNDGIHTRIPTIVSPDGKYQAKFIETSTPGLRGQSGGPIFDTNGTVWGLQSRTQSLSLGFAPEIVQGNQKIVEHQFMHVGWGSHVEEIIKMFQQFGVKFRLSSDPAV
jgi:hypothetical protein